MFHSTRPLSRVGTNLLLIRVVLAFIVSLLMGGQGYALTLRGNNECRHGEGKVKRIIGTVKVEITPTVDKDSLNEPICHLIVRHFGGSTILTADDDSIKVLLDNRDVNGDGIPDLVLEAYSGGTHCCWTYYFLSLSSQPGLITKFQNNRDVGFLEDEKTGRIYLEIPDGAFDYFDEVCHACSPFPLVYLRLDDTNWVDVSRDYVDDYDEIIRHSQKALTPKRRQRLRALKEKPSDAEPVERARYHALTIVFAYLYSGREEQARQALRELWPPFDQERIWNLILETRRNGILCYTHKNAVCGQDAVAQ